MPDTLPTDESIQPETNNEPAVDISHQAVGNVVAPQSQDQESTDKSPEQAPQPAEPYSPGGKKSRTWILLLLIVVILAGAGIAAYFVLKSGDQQAATEKDKKDIASLAYALPDGDLTQFYPNTNTSTALQLNTQLFEGLVRYDQQTKLLPGLATKWSNPNTSTWVFDLRTGVKFHSGRTMTAQDVKYSLDYAIKNQADEVMNNLAAASTIKKVEVTGAYQVKITTDGPDPILLNKLAFLFIMDSKGKVGDPDNGTGPYVVKPGTKPAEHSIDLVAAKNYYGGHIYTRELRMSVINDGTKMVKKVNDGSLDLAGSLDNYQLAKVTRRVQQVKVDDLGVSFLGLNTTRADSPLSTVAGRQAMTYAINVPALLKAGNFRGTPANQIIPVQLPGHDPDIKGKVYDPAKAKELLAGVKNASAPLTLMHISDKTNSDEAYFEELAKELKAVGFNVTLVKASDLGTIVESGFGGTTDIFSLTDDTATVDGLALFTDLLQGNAIYHNAEIDDLISQASTTINTTNRTAILQHISQIVARDVPVIPMYTPSSVFALKNPNYYPQMDIPSAYAGVYFWQTYQK